MQLLPDWLHGFVPPGWWPDRPRQPWFVGLNMIPFIGGASITIEKVFDKRRDVLIFGGCALVTNVANTTINCPNAGTFSSILVNMRNPVDSTSYSDGNIIGTLPFPNTPGMVALESLFAVGQWGAKRPVYWPIPIPVKRGGSLIFDLLNMNATVNVRFGFWGALIYDEREAA